MCQINIFLELSYTYWIPRNKVITRMHSQHRLYHPFPRQPGCSDGEGRRMLPRRGREDCSRGSRGCRRPCRSYPPLGGACEVAPLAWCEHTCTSSNNVATRFGYNIQGVFLSSFFQLLSNCEKNITGELESQLLQRVWLLISNINSAILHSTLYVPNTNFHCAVLFF